MVLLALESGSWFVEILFLVIYVMISREGIRFGFWGILGRSGEVEFGFGKCREGARLEK